MNWLLSRIRSSSIAARVAPFAIFAALTTCQALTFLGPAAPYWIYFGKTLVGAALVWATWPVVAEMRWKFSPAAFAFGIGVFVLWVGLDPLVKSLGLSTGWLRTGSSPVSNPLVQFAAVPALGWFFVVTRIAGTSLVVPMIEEVFYRSFLYRYIQKIDLLNVPLGRFVAMPFFVTSLIFGLAHHEWLAGLLCGFCYQGLVCWKGRASDAIAAHGITNFLLGLWVVGRDAWQYW